ncbi:MAG: carboxypeptidase-like regulatory domain-containing protein [Pyrinomonadaceae bacterium]
MNKQIKVLGIGLAIAVCVVVINAQSGGDFVLKQGAITSGGGVTTDSPVNVFGVYGVIGQPVAGPAARNGAIGVSSGILSGAVPSTAAGVSISGRVTTPNGRGLLNAVVTVTGPDGAARNAMTSGRGNFRFDAIETGKTYIISVGSRRFTFTPQVISVTDSLTGINFTGQ